MLDLNASSSGIDKVLLLQLKLLYWYLRLPGQVELLNLQLNFVLLLNELYVPHSIVIPVMKVSREVDPMDRAKLREMLVDLPHSQAF